MSDSEAIWDCPRCGGAITADDVEVDLGEDGFFDARTILVTVTCPTCHQERVGMVDEADLDDVDEDAFDMPAFVDTEEELQ